MLKWGIIGCGDVVQRLVQNSLQVKNNSLISDFNKYLNQFINQIMFNYLI